MRWSWLALLLLACAPDKDGDGFRKGDDCDDGDAEVFPGAPEYCNEKDDDCDVVVDEPDAFDADPYWVDEDADGFGDPLRLAKACTFPNGWSDNDEDCDDADEDVNPEATEVPGNSKDDDCNPATAD